MDILTVTRWYLLEVLICISLIFSNIDIFTCDFFKQCELNLFKLAPWRPALFLVFFCWRPRGHFLRAGVFNLQPAGLVWPRGTAVPVSKGFKVVVMGNGHKVAACLYAPTLVTGGTRALEKVLFLDCQLEWNVPEEIPKACVPFLLSSLPLSPGHIPVPATPLRGGCFIHRWVTLRKEPGGGNTITWKHEVQGAFKAPPVKRLHILWVQ